MFCFQVEKQTCQDIPREQCTKVPRQVESEQCQKVPREVCTPVPRDVCTQVPKETCVKVGLFHNFGILSFECFNFVRCLVSNALRSQWITVSRSPGKPVR